MLNHLKSHLEELRTESRVLKGRQDQLEQLLKPLFETPQARVRKALNRLQELIANGKANPQGFQSATEWIEMEDLVEELRTIKSRLPVGLFRRVWLQLRDCRRRLEHSPRDAHAVRQLEYIEKVLANVASKLEVG